MNKTGAGSGDTGTPMNQPGESGPMAEKIKLTTSTGQPKDYTIEGYGDSVTLAPAGSAVKVGPDYAGSLAILTVGTAGTHLEGHYKVDYKGGSLKVSPAEQAMQNVPPEPAAGASSIFSLSTSSGAVAVFGFSYADGAVSIDSLNPAAAAIASDVGGNRNVAVASALLAAQDKLGVALDSVKAVYIYQP